MKNVYFIGIGGIGMSAIARYYKHIGLNVGGYDKTPSKLTKALEEEGIQIHYTENTSYIPINIENTLVIYTPAIPEDFSELKYVREKGYSIIKRSKALGEIAKNQKCLAVAGTHGKTTTSTLLAHIYTSTNVGCSAFLGGISKNYHTNLILSRNRILVAEADEYDRSFLQLFPDTAVITSTDADHLDIYGNVEELRKTFSEFASQIKSSGYLILKKNIEIDLSNVKAKVYTYSYNLESDFYAQNIRLQQNGYFKFDLVIPNELNLVGSEIINNTRLIKNITVGAPGWINVENAVAASAVSLLNGISVNQLKTSLESYLGVERRLDIHFNSPESAYIDDYAHHPKEISSAIDSIKEIFPGRKICGIFQPHLYTRTRDFATEFAESLSKLDELILLDIYPARELPIEGVTSELIFNQVKISDKQMMKKEDLLNYIKSKKFDILVTFGAGDIDRFIGPITDIFKQKE